MNMKKIQLQTLFCGKAGKKVTDQIIGLKNLKFQKMKDLESQVYKMKMLKL
jgi:hypothetical protein